MQEAPALTNALISNNSWNYDGDNAYDLAAASYDAAVRDALPEVTGSQPVLFVFSAGNDGNGDDTTDPGSGTPDTHSVAGHGQKRHHRRRLEELRNITNQVTNADGTVSTPWQPETSTSYRSGRFFEPRQRGHRHGRHVMGGSSRTWSRRGHSSFPPAPANGTSTRISINPTNYNVQHLSVIVQARCAGSSCISSCADQRRSA